MLAFVSRPTFMSDAGPRGKWRNRGMDSYRVCIFAPELSWSRNVHCRGEVKYAFEDFNVNIAERMVYVGVFYRVLCSYFLMLAPRGK